MKCAWRLSTSKYFLAYVSIMKIVLCLTKNSLKIRKKDKKKPIGKIFSFNGKVSKYIYDLTNVNNTNDLSAASKYLVSVVCCREKMLSLNFFLCETGFYFAQTYPQMSNIPAKYLLSNISC